MPRIAVVGGGLTGLTAAYRLAQKPNTQVLLLEGSSRAGGWAQTHRVPVGFQRDGHNYEGEVVVEAGPRSIRPRGSLGSPAMLKLVGVIIDIADERLLTLDWRTISYQSHTPTQQPRTDIC